MSTDFDVVVVGGAMAGAGTAALLAAMPTTMSLRVALVEPRPVVPPAPDAPLDVRVSAVSRASCCCPPSASRSSRRAMRRA